MRSAALLFGGIVIVSLFGLLLLMGTDTRRLAFTLGVIPSQPAATLFAGQQVCQMPIDVPATASDVRLKVATFDPQGPPLEISARDVSGKHVSSSTHLRGGYKNGASLIVPLAGIEAGRQIAICIRDEGRRPVAVIGAGALAARTSAAVLDGTPLQSDLSLTFLRSDSRSMVSALPDVFRRATLWHPGWVGPWTLWLLLVLFVAGVPVLLWRGIVAAQQVSRDSYDSRP